MINISVLKIGWGRREYSLDEPVNIPGQMYMRRSEGILDPLYITALCIDGGKDCDAVIFCCVDITGLSGWLFRALDDLYAARPDIPRDSVIVNATHTHTSMSFNNKEDAFPDGSYLYNGEKVYKHFIKKFTEAVSEAWDTRAEGGISYGYGYAVVGHSRRSTYAVDMSVKKPNAVAPNGHAVMYGKTNDPDFLGYEAGADHFLNAMYTFDKNGALTGIVANVPCPSQVSEALCKLSSDYWHDVRVLVAEKFGKNVYVLPQCAAAGDLSPRILHYLPAQQRRFRLKYGLESKGKENTYGKVMGERFDIAERIVNALLEVYSWSNKDIYTDISVYHTYEKISISRRLITEAEKAECEANIKKMENEIPDKNSLTSEEYRVAMSRYNAIRNRNLCALEKYNDQKEHPTVDTYVHTVRIGDIAFATNRFELYMDYMHRIQARSPFIQTFVVQLAGDEGARYLPTTRAMENKGYGASMYCNVVADKGGHELVEYTLKQLEELAERN